ncbi:MAG: META domain-containing protein [Pyrinomonadaceae bacterium]|nr:META domain-containing protein [Pyrinomonadaceae bacterium]
MKKKIAILISIVLVLSVSVIAQSKLAGSWLLVSMTDEQGKEISLPKTPEITMTFDKGKIGARVCNNISGKYSAGKKSIKIDFTMSTLMACLEITVERDFERLAELATTYSIINNELILSGKKNKPILKFKKKIDEEAKILSGKWKLISMVLEKDMAIPLSEKPITLNISKNKIGGNGGCNSYGGDFLQKGKTVKFSRILSTKMWCDNGVIESQYLNALGKSVSYRFINEQLILTDEKKENTLVFEEIK